MSPKGSFFNEESILPKFPSISSEISKQSPKIRVLVLKGLGIHHCSLNELQNPHCHGKWDHFFVRNYFGFGVPMNPGFLEDMSDFVCLDLWGGVFRHRHDQGYWIVKGTTWQPQENQIYFKVFQARHAKWKVTFKNFQRYPQAIIAFRILQL